MQVKHGKVRAEGAQLYYETRGEGRPVLIIQGGLSEAGATQQLAEALACDHQVITYDRRGLSRSAVAEDTAPVTIATHADDVATLLSSVTVEPAYVVGASIGALIALHFAVRHPDRVATLVAHEPPMATVVLDAEREAALDEIAALAREDVRAAIGRMASLTRAGQGSAEEGARPASAVGDLDANLGWFFTHDFPAVRTSELDSGQIATAARSTTIVLTGGQESRGQWEYRCAEQLAGKIGRPFVELPGGHGALVSHPRAVADRLKSLFAGAEVRET
ncbi:alpha/beta hydrolase [Amycolatopsis rhizosphaerae]|uniref:Alpha/beta hydrolase n=1 Tax=Amycolatopsis rhizosphaerae TaxID=2053003 RepID=A0A558DLV9_9PSEU|nr:alpha/beta fold hydrolase [Amycolatopsis rhizosphaerae]TVT61964.1 alpha/beta hydrolase [Amycolatopsis rhizosphaerae]